MNTHYLKRYRMEIDLRVVDLPVPVLPQGYVWQPWSKLQVMEHARVTVTAFQGSVDCHLFPRLADEDLCRGLMQDIYEHDCFVPQATWLIQFLGNDFSGPFTVGAVQGLGDFLGTAAIQNVAILPEHRHLGLGRALVLKALHGFASRRMFRVTLDVSAENLAAVKLYESLGFRHEKTSFRKLATPRAESVSP